jgi:galactosamine-6-phosphate isomerase
METFIADTYEIMSKQAADDVIRLMQSYNEPLICTASGHSPAGLYEEIIDRVNQKQLDTSDWNFVALDEWVGLNENDEGSCRYHLNRELFHALNINDDKICFFNGKAKNLNAECENVEGFISRHQGIDVAVLGVGMNGHIGMNEPGVSPVLRSHVTDLHPITQKVGQKYFKEQQQLTKGITLGLATIIEARHIILVISGAHKAEIVKKFIEGEISEQLPASLLRPHAGLRIYLDADAAQMIQL